MPVARRISIGFLMVVVGLVAVDFAIVRGVWDERSVWPMVAVVALPTINVLILAAPRLRRGNPTRPYWLGFELVGWATALGAGFFCWRDRESLLYPLILIFQVEPINRFCQSMNPILGVTVEFAALILFYSPILLLPAVVAGKLSARYRLRCRVVIERR